MAIQRALVILLVLGICYSVTEARGNKKHEKLRHHKAGSLKLQGDNVALNKPASQSTTYVFGSTVYPASYAIDGSLSTKSCTVKTDGQPQWWSVDLGQPRPIKAVQVAGDTDDRFPERLDNLKVWLSNTQPTVGQAFNTAQSTLCYQYNGRIPLGSQPVMECQAARQFFRYVILQSSHQGNPICFREVQVFAGDMNNQGSGSGRKMSNLFSLLSES